MFLWDQVKGKDNYQVIDWSPYVFIPHEQGDVKTLDGIPVIKKEFDAYHDYSDYQKNNSNIYENDVPREVQFLCERYHNIPDADMEVPKLKVYSLDIETMSGRIEGSSSSFPKPSEALHTITLINVRHFGGKNISWGIKNYTGEDLENNTFVHCKSEIDLLQQFFSWWRNNAPDVVTGWNIMSNSKMNPKGGFDLPYLINRTKVLFGEKNELYKSLSPIGIVRTYEEKDTGSLNVTIAGVSIIDYLALYKWYTPKSPDSYKLDTICQLELNQGKLDYSEYGSLNDLFHKNWNMYVEYNMIDNKRIEQLEEVLGYIRLAQNLSLLCKSKMDAYMNVTTLVESAMLVHYRRNGLCAPYLYGGSSEHFPAAYVKEPKIGRHQYVIDLDVTSSYPTAQITLNMSPEVKYGRVVSYVKDGRWTEMISATKEDDNIEDVIRLETPITEFTKAREFPPFKMKRNTGIVLVDGDKLTTFNKALKRGLICVAPCGTMFMTNKKGQCAIVEHEMFKKRVEIKSMMKQVKTEAQKTASKKKKDELNTKAANLNAMQTAYKLFLNGFYGTFSSPFSRYYDIDVAEAITSCGRRAIKNGEIFTNELLNEPLSYEPMKEFLNNKLCNVRSGNITDYVAYIDTDSLFLKCKDFLFDNGMTDEVWNSYTEDERIQLILELSSVIEKYVNDRSYNETQLGCYNSQVKKEEFAISFKQEVVARSILFIKKKKYGYHIVNKEGVPCDSIEVTGLEIIRSDTPKVFREALKELLSIILKGGDKTEIMSVYNKYKDKAKTVSVEDISENKGVKEINKFLIEGKTIKGTPYHVKAVISYHDLLKQLNLEDKYPEISEDSKNKLVCIKNNPWGVKRVMYDVWPNEFNKAGIEPDVNEMIDKYYTKKLIMLLEPMEMSHIVNENQSFNIFFG